MENVALDFAESQLHKNIKAGKEISTIFYLKTKGRKRGYIEKQDIEGQLSLNVGFTGNAGISLLPDEELQAIIALRLKGGKE